MNAYPSPHWPENGPSYYENDLGSRGRPYYRPQDPRRESISAPYGGREYRPSEVSEWNHYHSPRGRGMGTPPHHENGFREESLSHVQHRGEPPHMRPDHRAVANSFGDVGDPRIARSSREGPPRDAGVWNRYGDSPSHSPSFEHHGGPPRNTHESYLSHYHPTPVPPGGHCNDGNYHHTEGYHTREGDRIGGELGKRVDDRTHPYGPPGQYEGGSFWREGPEARFSMQRRAEFQHHHSPMKVLLPTPAEERRSSGGYGYQQKGGRGFNSYSTSPSSSWGSPTVDYQDLDAPRHLRAAPGEERHGMLEGQQMHGHNPMDYRDRVQNTYRAMKENDREFLHSDRLHGPHMRENSFPHGPRSIFRHSEGRLDGNAMRRSGSLESVEIKDPRVHRKVNTLPSSPVSGSNQIMREHSYCRRPVDGSVLEPISDKNVPYLQQHTASCFLTLIARSVPQQKLPPPTAGPVAKYEASSATGSNNKDANAGKESNLPTAEEKRAVEDKSPVKDNSKQYINKVSMELEGDLKGVENKAEEESQVVQFRMKGVSDRQMFESYNESPEVSLEGFVLDLDTEPDTSEEETVASPDSAAAIASAQWVQGDHWSIISTGRDELHTLLQGADVKDEGSLKISLRQFPSNQIQLRNGRVLPSSTLAIYATRKGAPPMSPSSSRDSTPETDLHRQRRRRRPVYIQEEDDSPTAGGSGVEDEGMLRIKYDPDSDESIFDINLDDLDSSDISADSLAGTPTTPTRGRQRSSVRKRNRRGVRRLRYPNKKTDSSGSPTDQTNLEGTSDGSPSPKRRKRNKFEDFTPCILETRSRTESMTLHRRKEMEKEIEQHELERKLTARPGELEYSQDDDEYGEQDGDDDGSSTISNPYTISSGSLGSRDIDSSTTKSSIAEEFSPDLIRRCKNISTARSSGDTPLHKVCRTGKHEMARYLILVERVVVNVQDHAGWTPLHEACSNGYIRIAELLLQNGANANISATDGTRPIHDAIEYGSLDLVKLLVQFGADPLAEFGEKTPLEFARAIDQQEIYQYLQEFVKERQRARLHPTTNPELQKLTSARQSHKEKLLRQSEVTISIPVDGYSPSDPMFGSELDYPLFYISPIVEMSDCPHLPVYNFQISQGSNPRRHNFYILEDLLEELSTTESEFPELCPDVGMLELTVGEFLRRTKHQCFVSVPDRMRSLPKNSKVRFVPLCSKLRELLDIFEENLDD